MKIYHSIFLSLLFVVNGFLTSSVFAANDGAGSDTAQLTGLLKNYQTLSGNFQQKLVDDKGEIIQESSGDFVVKKPGFFHWQTQEPFPQLLVSNLEKIWLYDPDLEQVTIRAFNDTFDQSPALLLSGDDKKIAKRYQITKKSEAEFLLIPAEGQASSFTELYLVFEKELLTNMILKDSLQQTTTFSFSNLALNKTYSKGFFDFNPPDGVDVLVDD
jgi:outer membrane lipoprotein carrier protein